MKIEIFKKIGKSIYGPDLYKDLKQDKPGSSVAYYFKFVLILSIILGIFWGIGLVANINSYLTIENVSRFTSIYPAELDLKVQNGEFSTNVQEPYHIPVPKEWNLGNATNTISNLVVIDTSVDKFSPDILTENKTMFFVTKNSLISDKKGTLQVMSIWSAEESEV